MTENYIVAEESSRKSGGKKRKEKNLAPWLDTRNCLSPCENYTRVYVLDSCGRTRERGKGKKRSENVRRGWRTGEKAGEYRLDSRKGLSTFSHDTICCRNLTDNASAGAKYVLSFSPLFLSSRPLRETARPSRYPASVQLRTRLFEPRVVLGLVSTVSAETRKG